MWVIRVPRENSRYTNLPILPPSGPPMIETEQLRVPLIEGTRSNFVHKVGQIPELRQARPLVSVLETANFVYKVRANSIGLLE